MADDVIRVLGEERTALEADLPLLKEVLKSLQKERSDLAVEEQELENLEKLILSTRKALDELLREAFKLIGGPNRTDKDVEEFTKQFFNLKKEVQLINSINGKLVELFTRRSETEMRARPLFHALAAHALNLHTDFVTVQRALYGTDDWFVPEDRSLPEYVGKFKGKHPSDRR